MPKTRPLKPPPDERPNWHRLNEGQRRYAWEQYNLAKVRRGINIDHPIPEIQQEERREPELEEDHEPTVSPEEQQAINDFDLSLLDSSQEETSQDPIGFDFNNDLGDIQADLDSMAEVSSSAGTTKRQQSDQRGAPAKRRAMGSNLPGTAGGQGGPMGENSQSIEEIPRPINLRHTQLRHYKKVHRFLTFGLAYKPIVKARTGTPPYNDVFMITSMAEIPWDRVFMYLNPSEYELLPPGARVKHVSCSVKSENIRVAFPTNSSDSGLATLNQNKFIRIGKGLLQKTQSVNVKPTQFNATQPMITTAIDEMSNNDLTAYGEYVANFYGVPNNQTGSNSFLTQTPRHQFGIPWVLQYYYAPVSQDTDPSRSGWEDIQSVLEEINVDGPPGTICHMEYNPGMALLKPAIRSIWTGVPSSANGTSKVTVPHGSGNTQARTLEIGITEGLVDTVSEIDKDYRQALINSLVSRIDDAQRNAWGIMPEFRGKTQPTLHVGVMPVPALTSNAISNSITNSSFTDTQAYFEVTCNMTVECEYPTKRPLAMFPNTGETDLALGRVDGFLQANNKTMYAGVYQNV